MIEFNLLGTAETVARYPYELMQIFESAEDLPTLPEIAVRLQEVVDDLRQVVDQLVGEDFAGGDVVAVTEAAGYGDNLIRRQRFRVLNQAVDVDAVGAGARLFPGELGLEVAVGSGGSQN